MCFRHPDSSSCVVFACLCALLNALACDSSDDGDTGGTDAMSGSAGSLGGSTEGGLGGTPEGGAGKDDAEAGEAGRIGNTGGEVGDDDVNGSAGAGGSMTPACPTLTGDPVVHTGEILTVDATWSGWHRVEGALTLQAKLELAPCTVVAFGNAAALHVYSNGSLQAKGIEGQPVLFTSAKAAPKPGDWSGIQVGLESLGDSLLEHVIVEYGTDSIKLNANASMGLSDVVVRRTADDGTPIYLAGRPYRFEDVRIEENARGLLLDANNIGSLGSFSSDGPPIRVAPNTITEDAVWRHFNVPYLLEGPLTLQSHVEIEPGVVIQMANQGYLSVLGAGILEAIGTASDPVRFTSSKTPPAPGDWSAISVSDADDNASRLEHVVLEYGGYGDHSLAITPGATVALSHVTITHSNPANCALSYGLGAFVGPFDQVDLRGNAYPLCVPFSEVGNLGALSADEGAVALVGAETSNNDAAWKDLGVAYRITGNVNERADLVIEAGVKVEVAHASSIHVVEGGTLNVVGTEDAPVTFKSTLAVPSPGEWGQLDIRSDAGPINSLSYTLIQDGGWNDAGALLVNMHAVPLDHVTFENNGACDVRLLNDGTVPSDLSSTWATCQ
jgi:hypothetical protein